MSTLVNVTGAPDILIYIRSVYTHGKAAPYVANNYNVLGRLSEKKKKIQVSNKKFTTEIS